MKQRICENTYGLLELSFNAIRKILGGRGEICPLAPQVTPMCRSAALLFV